MKKGMMKGAALLLISALTTACGSGDGIVKSGEPAGGIPAALRVEAGTEYTHRIPVFLMFGIDAPPQMAVWIEDEERGERLTLFVTEKTATGKWRKAPGDDIPKELLRRPESLPYWMHRVGGSAGGSTVPVPAGSEHPAAVDATAGATPKNGYSLDLRVPERFRRYRIFLEVNASLDFNERYPADARPSDPGYSGGAWGSGQPALVYAASVDRDSRAAALPLRLEGCSSPDGSSGSLSIDLSGITSAREIISAAVFSVR